MPARRPLSAGVIAALDKVLRGDLGERRGSVRTSTGMAGSISTRVCS
jgi:hypothetical protein